MYVHVLSLTSLIIKATHIYDRHSTVPFPRNHPPIFWCIIPIKLLFSIRIYFCKNIFLTCRKSNIKINECLGSLIKIFIAYFCLYFLLFSKTELAPCLWQWLCPKIPGNACSFSWYSILLSIGHSKELVPVVHGLERIQKYTVVMRMTWRISPVFSAL